MYAVNDPTSPTGGNGTTKGGDVVGRVATQNRKLKQYEKRVKTILEEGTPTTLKILVFLGSVVALAYGSVYIHECTAKKDSEINFPMFYMTFLVVLISLAVIGVFSVRYGRRKTSYAKYVGICFFMALLSCTSIVGVFNALTTPNDAGWNMAGQIIGGIQLFVGFVGLGFFVYMIYSEQQGKAKRNGNGMRKNSDVYPNSPRSSPDSSTKSTGSDVSQ
jgi:MFS family permease